MEPGSTQGGDPAHLSSLGHTEGRHIGQVRTQRAQAGLSIPMSMGSAQYPGQHHGCADGTPLKDTAVMNH